MGLGAIDYALHCDRRPGLLVVTDIDEARLMRAKSIYTVEHAKEMGVELVYLNTAKGDAIAELNALSGDTGYDDVIVFAPVKQVVEQGDAILGFDGCLNFFAGPSDAAFTAEMNFYNVHYAYHHIVGTSGGNIGNMREAVQMMNEGKLNPAAMVTHIGGQDCVVDTTLNGRRSFPLSVLRTCIAAQVGLHRSPILLAGKRIIPDIKTAYAETGQDSALSSNLSRHSLTRA